MGAGCLFVGRADHDEGAGGPTGRSRQAADGDGHGRGEVEHVDRATTPDLTVDQVAPEGIAGPASGGGDHVEVTHQRQGRSRRVSPLEPHDDRPPPWGGLEGLQFDARAGQVLDQHIGVAHLVAGADVSVVHAGVADQLLQEVGDLVGLGRGGHRRPILGGVSSRGARQGGWAVLD